MTDKIREEFEAFAARDGESLSRYSEDECGEKYRDFVGRYVNHDIEIMWDAWKASRAALCVELPKQWFDDEHDCDLMEAHKVGKALYAAGVRYK